MADPKNTAGTGGKIDHDKVKAEGEKLASGGGTPAGDKDSGAHIDAGNQPGTQQTADTQQSAPNPQAAAQEAAQGRKSQPITQRNPGALKPGAVAENKQPGVTRAQVSEDDAEGELHAQLLKEYGPGFVRAEKKTADGKGVQTTTFSAVAWNLLGSNKEGWKPVTQIPQEVKELEAQKGKN